MGDLDIARLERCVDRVVERHEVLRSNYRMVENGVELVVRDARRIPVERMVAGTEEGAISTAARLVRRPFDLGKDPLLRLHYLSVPDGSDLLILVVHDIVFDKWSLGRFWSEVAELYRGGEHGSLGELEPLPIQYSDFAEWQREVLEPEGLARQRDYWRQELSGCPVPLALPTDRAYPDRLTDAGRLERWSLPPVLRAGLQRLAASEDASLFTILLLGFQILLARYSGTGDVIVASPIANRRKRETTELIGFFLSTLPFRAQLDERATLREALRQARARVLGALENQDLPFDRVVEAVRPPRVAGRHPLCQVMFVYQRQHEGAPEFDLGDVELRHRYIDTGTSKYDLTLFAAEAGEGMETLLEYRTALFDAGTMRRVLMHYERLLSSIVEFADEPMERLEFLTGPEERALLEDWQGEPIPAGVDETVVDQIGRCVATRSDHLAVLSRTDSWTYDRLGRTARRIATQLLEAGVEPGQCVAHFVDRSPYAIAAILGILRAGAAYVPLDPEYPPQRQRDVIDDAQIAVAVTTRSLVPSIEPWVERALVVDADVEMDHGGADAMAGPGLTDRGPSLDDPAYLIYTSGSTGKPKGVAVSHRNLYFSTAARPAFYGRAPQRFLLIPSLAFDSSVAGLFWALTAGAVLVIADSDEQRDPSQLAALIRDRGVTDLLCIPSLYRELLNQAAGRLGSLRCAIVAGESCPRDLVDLHYEIAPEAKLFNEYGPTEATVWATVHRCSRDEPEGPVSIGRPIPGTQVHVLDRARRPQPVGVPGELFIGGPGVVAGYRGRPARTRETFVEVPFEGGRRRLYATGDIGRRRVDGSLDFLGRVDGQVKVRGYRIELGEVETGLRAHPNVADAAAAIRGEGGADRLVGYFTPSSPTQTPTDRQLRDYLRGRLPGYAVPHLFVAVERLPVTPNGKVDRAALPKPPAHEARAADRDRQLSDVERRLIRIWEEVLGSSGISVDDDFFAVGGDSLISIQIVSRARSEGIDIAPRDIADDRTIARLALRSGTVEATAEETVEDRTGRVPLTPIQRWFFSRGLAQPEQWCQALAVEIDERLRDDHIECAVEALERHHDQLRAGFSRSAGGWVQEVPTRANLLTRLEPPVPRQDRDPSIQAVEEMRGSFRFDGSPLAKFALVHSGSERRLVIVAHHLVIDAVSWSILLDDLESSLVAQSSGRVFELPDRTVSFARWARWFDATTIAEEADYWAAPAALPGRLPTDRTWSGDLVEHDSSVVTLELPAALSRQLFGEALVAYSNRVEDLLLATLVRSLSRLCSSGYLRIGLERHGRDVLGSEHDLSRTVGWFTSAFPIRLSSEPKESIETTLKRVKETLRAVPNSGAGYGHLRYGRDPQIERRLAADEPAEDVLFNYLGRAPAAPSGSRALRTVERRLAVARAPEHARSHLLEINAERDDDRLVLHWTYNARAHERTTIARWADDYRLELQSVVEHCLSDQAGGYTPSDFPEAGLSQDELDALIESL